MFQGLNVVAFIPARGGSKGLPGKNLMKLGGRTLIRRAIESTQLTDDFEGFADFVVVSSDSAEILAEARNSEVELSQVTPDPDSDFGLTLRPYIRG